MSTGRHDAGTLAQQLHTVIRGTPRSPDLLERAICVIDELARATRITARVWSETFHAIRQETNFDR